MDIIMSFDPRARQTNVRPSQRAVCPLLDNLAYVLTPQGSNIVGKVWNDTRGSFMGQKDIRAIPAAGMLHSHELQVLCCDCMFGERQGGCGKTGTLPRPFPLPSMLHVHVENHLRPPTGHDNKLLFCDIAS